MGKCSFESSNGRTLRGLYRPRTQSRRGQPWNSVQWVGPIARHSFYPLAQCSALQPLSYQSYSTPTVSLFAPPSKHHRRIRSPPQRPYSVGKGPDRSDSSGRGLSKANWRARERQTGQDASKKAGVGGKGRERERERERTESMGPGPWVVGAEWEAGKLNKRPKELRSRQKFCALCVTRPPSPPLAVPEYQHRVQIRTTQHTWAMLSTDDSLSGLADSVALDAGAMFGDGDGVNESKGSKGKK
ncbi:hypothetical protein CTA1_7075 [Colletotrichum tanaceti]|uniref:Uncharacterized protein n=1 Tax=Colletotrichum tanaceti TaxID=1306861 RepID=A0A4U6XTG3_9PEZI|nr:hypothetical protein CTA1_7075 [Colletotrichum tanaceti]